MALAHRLLRGVAAGLPAFNTLRSFFSNLLANEIVRLFRASANMLEAGWAAETLPVRSRQFLKDIPIVTDLREPGELADRITYAVELTFEREPDLEETRLVYIKTDAPLSRQEAKEVAASTLRKEVRKARRRRDYEGELLPSNEFIESKIIFVGRRF